MIDLTAKNSFIAQKAQLAALGRLVLRAYCRAQGHGLPANESDLEAEIAGLVATLYHYADIAQLDPFQIAETAMRNYSQEARSERDERKERNFYEPIDMTTLDMLAAEMHETHREPPAKLLITLDDDGPEVRVVAGSMTGTLYVHYKDTGEVIFSPLIDRPEAFEEALAELTENNPAISIEELERQQQARIEAGDVITLPPNTSGGLYSQFQLMALRDLAEDRTAEPAPQLSLEESIGRLGEHCMLPDDDGQSEEPRDGYIFTAHGGLFYVVDNGSERANRPPRIVAVPSDELQPIASADPMAAWENAVTVLRALGHLTGPAYPHVVMELAVQHATRLP